MTKKRKEPTDDYLDIYSNLDDDLDAIEKNTTLVGASLSKHEERTSTGLLALDILLGGGITGGGWYTVFGAEQSCKSTLTMTILANLLKTDIPICTLADYEGCVVGDTEVITEKGVVTIKELFAQTKAEGPLGRIPEPLRFHVESVSGLHQVSHIVSKGNKPITTIKTSNNKELTGYKHPLLKVHIEDINYPSTLVFLWTYIEDLCVGDRVIVKDVYGQTGTQTIRDVISEDNHNQSIVDDLQIATITSTEALGYEYEVFDITVVTDDKTLIPHSFYANSIVTHNSTQPDYVENIMKTQGITGDITSLFGLRDPQTGKWLKAPRIRNYQPDTGEEFFDYVAKLQRLLPDKVLFGDQWYYVYTNTKSNAKKVGNNYDEAYFKSTGKYRVKAKDGGMQAIILVDSYPSMLPRAQDVDSPSNALATQARMFSDGIKRIKGSMRKKRMSILGINQLRDKPMVMFGCFYYDSKVTLADGTSRAIGDIVTNEEPVDVLAYNKDTGMFESRRVISWFNNGKADNNTFIEITTQHIDINGNSVQDSFKVTLLHNILRYGASQEEPVKDFRIGDCLAHTYSNDIGSNSVPATIVDIQKFTLPKGVSHARYIKYDIEVEGLSNYVVEGHVVHNSPEYEPCGQSLKFYSDVRLRVSSIVMPKTFGKGRILEEDSVTNDGIDTYRFIKCFGFKNKLSIPYLDTVMRLWVTDSSGAARGFDPVYDTYQYLLITGQIGGTRNNMKFIGTPFDGISRVKWLDFKLLVVGRKEDIKIWCQDRDVKPTVIRQWCKRQMASGKGLELFRQEYAASTSKSKSKSKASGDDVVDI